MHKTKIDLPEETRRRVIAILNDCLAEGVDLKSQAKQAHWNVKGPSFIALHELFDDVASAVEAYTDLVAERITTLGGIAEGTVRVAAARSTLGEYPLNIAGGKTHVDALSTALASVAKLVRKAIDQTAGLGDADTADLFTEVSRGIDKHLWLVEAHLHSED